MAKRNTFLNNVANMHSHIYSDYLRYATSEMFVIGLFDFNVLATNYVEQGSQTSFQKLSFSYIYEVLMLYK